MFQSLFDPSKKEIQKCTKVVKEIKSLEHKYSQLSDIELRNKTKVFQSLLRQNYSLELLLVDAFAIVKEAIKRVLDITLYDVQLIGGIILHSGKISEMKTGEGKTLVAVLAAYLNALNENGVHIITVNDYLALRDFRQIGPVFTFLGLSVGVIQEQMSTAERKKNYSCDITYVTNNQLGFDYLRDNTTFAPQNIVLRPFYYCIIDEIDSILIDEARTPLIISSEGNSSTERYTFADQIAKSLIPDTDYEIDKKNQNIVLTDIGLRKCEQYLNVDTLYQVDNPWASFILNSLRANIFYIKDRNYIIKDDQVIIVDDNTGRIMEGRRWSDGLHQAIEAKESLPIVPESKTLASVTYQNFFLLYDKISGMTGTAKTEELEFEKIYGLKTIAIPTNRPLIRQDYEDVIYKNDYAKWKAVANECYDMYHQKRPVLVGTTSVEFSELLSSLLQEYKIPHNLLNAKPQNTARESEIIAQAGRLGTITIATNMAGRGTDIILGGNPQYLTKSILHNLTSSKYETCNINKILQNLKLSPLDSEKLSIFNNLTDTINKKNKKSLLNNVPYKILDNNQKKEEELYQSLNALYYFINSHVNKCTQLEKEKITSLGGLYVIGTERHASRRIDNQLRGRAGRQGDPGASRFFLSLDDMIFQRFAVDKIKKMIDTMLLEDDIPIQASILTATLENAQKQIESLYFDQRKNIFEYDQIISQQRFLIYSERRRILTSPELDGFIYQYAFAFIKDLIVHYLSDNKKNKKLFLWTIQNFLGMGEPIQAEDLKYINEDFLYSYLCWQFDISYRIKKTYLNSVFPNGMISLERYLILTHMDSAWTQHLQKVNLLTESVGWRAYGQEDPIIAYKYDAFLLFINMSFQIRQQVIYDILSFDFNSDS
uniref:Protein translocase subunit SecA n=1 Tax=Porphyridium purpureum TaxID=35688 RepID=W0S1Q2_PORPP|nr:preprotein translocase subunit secA [Porphyridium purpureum]BAO23633.1 preprotein translocase subunit secA [Porphyridium purpureum]